MTQWTNAAITGMGVELTLSKGDQACPDAGLAAVCGGGAATA